MKKIRWIIVALLMAFCSVVFAESKVSAAEVYASVTSQDIFGDTISKVTVYSNGKIELEYKYGIRKADVYYCVKGEECDNGTYSVINIVDATALAPFKNTESGLAKHTYNLQLDSGFQYRVRVEAFFGTSSAYSGTESIYGSFTVGSVQVADTNENYINGKSLGGIGDQELSGAMGKIQVVVNKAVLPIIYIITTLFFIIKGTILGFQIVKSADEPSTRREKIHGLKWLIIGVGITYAATSVVGLVSGFFKTEFGLNF